MNTLQNRFTKCYSINPLTKCWEWRLILNQTGYGRFYINSKKYVRAHRMSYELFIGKIPVKMCIDHLCRNRSCVNPKHLEAVTNKVNILRGVGITANNARKIHCKHGHPFSGDNLVILKNGHRLCRQCRKIYLKRFFDRTRNK